RSQDGHVSPYLCGTLAFSKADSVARRPHHQVGTGRSTVITFGVYGAKYGPEVSRSGAAPFGRARDPAPATVPHSPVAKICRGVVPLLHFEPDLVTVTDQAAAVEPPPRRVPVLAAASPN